MTGALSDTAVLETERMVLRAPQAGDEAHMMPFAMSPRAQFIGGGEDCDAGHAWRMMATIMGHWTIRGYGTFVLIDKQSGAPVGSAGPWHPGNWPEEELGWTIWKSDYEGKGYAHEAMLTLRRHVYGDLGWHTAVSYIDPKNARSIALAERLGCTRDDEATIPYPDRPCLVYRHPSPAEILA